MLYRHMASGLCVAFSSEKVAMLIFFCFIPYNHILSNLRTVSRLSKHHNICFCAAGMLSVRFAYFLCEA